jgi:hypothetical protein
MGGQKADPCFSGTKHVEVSEVGSRPLGPGGEAQYLIKVKSKK